MKNDVKPNFLFDGLIYGIRIIWYHKNDIVEI